MFTCTGLMLAPQNHERSRSPVQMSPLLAQLVNKHGEESQKLISQVIYKYAKKGLKLRDLSFDKIDREVIACIQKGGMSESGASVQMRSALRKGPRNSGDSQVQFQHNPEIIMPSTTRNNMPKKLMPLNRVPSPPRQQKDVYQQKQINGYPNSAQPKQLNKRSSSVALAKEPGHGQREGHEFKYPEGRHRNAGHMNTVQQEEHHLIPRFTNGPLGNDGRTIDRRANNTLILENQEARKQRSLVTTPPQQRYTKGSGNSPPRSPHMRNQSAALPGNDSQLSNQFTAAQDIKPYPMRRDTTISKPKTLNMWDMLTLQDTLKKQQEDKAVKEIEGARKQQMKAYLDMQIAQKRQIKAQEQILERSMKDQIDVKVREENTRDDHISIRHLNLRKEIQAENVENRREKFDLVKQRNDWIKQQFIAKKAQDDATLNEYKQYIGQVRSDKKTQNRQQALRQMEGNQERSSAQKIVERNSHLRDLGQQDESFANREKNLGSHLANIQQRDAKLEQHFARPDIITHAKQEVKKDQKIGQMQQQMAQIEAHREFELERQRLVRMQSLKSEMMSQNANILHLKQKNNELQAAQAALENIHSNEKMMNTPRKSIQAADKSLIRQQHSKKGGPAAEADSFTMYNNGAQGGDARVTTRRQMNHEMDMHQYQQVAKEKQRLLKELLDHQVEQKALAMEKERLYKDDKELATSKQMLKQISPRIAQATAVTVNPNRPLAKAHNLPEAHKKGHPLQIGRDEALLAKEVNRLYQMVNGQQK